MFNYYGFDYSQFKADEILIYLRKSRTDDPLLTVEEVLQKHESILDEWAEKNLGTKIPEKNKLREVVSGETLADRSEMQRLLKLIESPKWKAVLVTEIQRLGRPDLEEIGKISKIFRFTNTLVITPEKTYDLRDDEQRDSFERRLKQGNELLEYYKKIQIRGKLISVSKGNFIGSIPPYGYDKIWITEGKEECPTLAINEEQANVVRMIFDMYVNQDLGRPTICHRLDEMGIKPPKGQRWSHSYLKDLLENIHYTGKVRYNWRKTVTIVEDSEIIKTRPKAKIGEYLIYEGKHEAIISEELFNAAREKQGRNHRAKPTTKVRNPFASILYCQCGRAMKYATYKSHNAPPRLVCIDQPHCHTGSCTYDEMVDIVANILRQCIDDFKVRIENDTGDAIKMHEKLLKTLEKKMQDLEAKEIAQWEAQSHPDPSQRMPAHIFKMLNEKVLKEMDEVKEAMCNARKSMPAPVNYKAKLHMFTEALNALLNPEADAEKTNRLLKDCIEKIEYNREKPERITNPEKRTRKNGRIDGKPLKPHPLAKNEKWTSPPIEVDIKLKV
ncbi:MAG: recombinase family protein [Bacteroidales bacterium]|nr:recombinase family protein [Bacteroidales bacterium]